MKEHIDEMAKVLIDYTNKNHIMASHVILEDYAEQLYTADYRKQSEGEWILTGTFKSIFPLPVANLHKACSVCRWSPPKYSDDYKKYKFCPNCGAKMKGGN